MKECLIKPSVFISRLGLYASPWCWGKGIVEACLMISHKNNVHGDKKN